MPQKCVSKDEWIEQVQGRQISRQSDAHELQQDLFGHQSDRSQSRDLHGYVFNEYYYSAEAMLNVNQIR